MSPKPFKLGDKCRAGHILTEENTYIEGSRLRCTDCLRARKPLKGKKLKTHCINGHEYTEESTYWYNGNRACRECRKNRVYETRSPGIGQGGINKAKTHCPQGHEYTPENTYINPEGRRTCRTCAKINNAAQVIKKYGITSEKFKLLLEEQEDKCKICRTYLLNLPTREIQIDHDHHCCDKLPACGDCVRGILCGECNRGLARFKDSTEILQSAIQYIRKYNMNKEYEA